jgi:ClpP class serine protease
VPHPKESIFTLIVKKFAGSFVSVIGFLLAFAIFISFIGFTYKSTAASITEVLPMKIHSIVPGAVAEPFDAKTPTILQINIAGMIGKKKDSMNTSAMIQKIFRQPSLYGMTNENVKGILLNMNTGGGSAAESDEMYKDIMAFKKKYNIPVHVWISDICASGGMYIASTGDYISAQTVTIIGSVGVRLGPFFNIYNFMEKVGLESTLVSAGKNKIHFPMFSPKPKGTASYNDIITITDGIYNRFLDVVTEARASHGLTRERLLDLGATVYGCADAKKLGYIDAANVRYNDAVTGFAKTLGIDEAKFQVVSFHNTASYLHSLQSKLENRFPFFFSGSDRVEPPFSLEVDFNTGS